MKFTSLQIYKGLDVVTAKASQQERAAATHHLLDILEPHQMFTVVDFRNRALKIIDNLTEQGKIPIVVGGTNYYIESIVYKILVEDMQDAEALLWDKSRRKRDFDEVEYTEHETISKKRNNQTKDPVSLDTQMQTSTINAEDNTGKLDINDERTKEKLKEDVDNESKFTNEEIHQKLKSFDPVMASRLHPNNRRKVLRSIEVWLKTGRLHSEILAEQKLSEGQLRRPGATIILWLKCEQPINVPTAGAQAFPMDGIGRLGHDPPRGPSADWWVLTTADAAGTNDLTYLLKHEGARDSNFWSPIQ
ncbi:hypothetical protein evm_008076 [Chilo suppressalis]|nr:hypothetical protein evm_008076 [Chilo suppressalis]